MIIRETAKDVIVLPALNDTLYRAFKEYAYKKNVHIREGLCLFLDINKAESDSLEEELMCVYEKVMTQINIMNKEDYIVQMEFSVGDMCHGDYMSLKVALKIECCYNRIEIECEN